MGEMARTIHQPVGMMSMIPTSGTTSVEFLFNYIKMSFWSQYDVFGLRDDFLLILKVSVNK